MMQKCQRCRDRQGDYLCRHDIVGTPRKDQEIIGYSEVKRGLLRLVRDSFQRSKDPAYVANLSAALIGDFGMGKSALAHFFVDVIENGNYDLALVSLQEDGVQEKNLQHFDSKQMATYRGAAIRIDARTVTDQLQRGQVTDCITPFFRKIGDEFGIPRTLTSVKDITEAILKKKDVSRLFVFIDEMEGLKETRYGLDFDEFFVRFTNDLRTLINGEGMYDVRNCITLVLCTVPSVWEEFKRREDTAGGLLTREYSEPFELQRFDLAQSYRFVERVCRNWENCPFTEKSIRTLHLASDGRPRLLTKLCKHVEGHLPAGDMRSGENYDLAALTTVALDRAVGSREQFTYAYDPISFEQIYEYLERESIFGSDHVRLFRLLVAQYGEYADDDLAEALGLALPRAQEVVRDLSSELDLVLGLRLISKGQLFDYADLAAKKVPQMMVNQSYLKHEDVEFFSATGEIMVFGKLDYYKQILPSLTVETVEGEKRIFVPFHKDDLALIWNLADEQADSLGKALRSSASRRGTVRYRLSEAARNRLFPAASQADLPFLSKDQYYRLRNATNNLLPEERNSHLVGGVMKLLRHQGFRIQERVSAECFDFAIEPGKLEQLVRGLNDDLGILGRVLVIDSAEAFEEGELAKKLRGCDLGLLICTRNFGGNQILHLPPGDEKAGPFCPTISIVVQSTRLETNLLVLSQVTQGDIAIEIEYQPTLERLCRELGLESFPRAWRELGMKVGICLREWQMKRGTSREKARETLSHLVRVTPSLPLSRDKAKDVIHKELGFPPTALPTWDGIEDLVALGFVSRQGQQYNVELSPTENAILEMIKHLGIDVSADISTPESIASAMRRFFWNFTSNPKVEELCDYVKLLQEKGLLIRRTEAEVKERAIQFSRIYQQAEGEDEYGGSIKAYCDMWTQARRKRQLRGIKGNFAYLNKHYQELLGAVRPEEILRQAYCASGVFDAYSDLSELCQEGESRYTAVKSKLDETVARKRATEDESKVVVENSEVILRIKGLTDKAWETIEQTLAAMIRFHREGKMDEAGDEFPTVIERECDKLEDTYRGIKDTLQDLRSRYDDVQELARRASQSPHRNQVSQELQDVNKLDPDTTIPALLRRYREEGRAAGDSRFRGYQDRLGNLKSTFEDFLDQQDYLEKLEELQQSATQLLSQIEDRMQDQDSLLVEGVERLDDTPRFFHSIPDILRNQIRETLDSIQAYQTKFSLRDDANVDSLEKQLAQLQSDLATHEENQIAFQDEIRQINYKLRTLFRQASFYHLEATYDKLLEDFRFQFQKMMQEVYRAETYQETEDKFTNVKAHAEQAEQCLKEISDLDNWFEQLKKDFKASEFEDTDVQNGVSQLAQRMIELEETLLYRFPKDIDDALTLLKGIQEEKRVSIERDLIEFRSRAERQCTQRIEETRRMIERFEQSLSFIKVQIREMLDTASAQRNEKDYAQSLKVTKQAVDKVMQHLEQAQDSRSVRIQVILLAQPSLDFPDLETAYEQRFGTSFDKKAATELFRLLKEGKVHGNFSI